MSDRARKEPANLEQLRDIAQATQSAAKPDLCNRLDAIGEHDATFVRYCLPFLDKHIRFYSFHRNATVPSWWIEAEVHRAGKDDWFCDAEENTVEGKTIADAGTAFILKAKGAGLL